MILTKRFRVFSSPIRSKVDYSNSVCVVFNSDNQGFAIINSILRKEERKKFRKSDNSTQVVDVPCKECTMRVEEMRRDRSPSDISKIIRIERREIAWARTRAHQATLGDKSSLLIGLCHD